MDTEEDEGSGRGGTVGARAMGQGGCGLGNGFVDDGVARV